MNYLRKKITVRFSRSRWECKVVQSRHLLDTPNKLWEIYSDVVHFPNTIATKTNSE